MDSFIYLPEYNEKALFESTDNNGNKQLFIEGPTLVYDQKNANGRDYPKKILTEAINTHIGNGVLESGGCVGELNHPLGGRSQTDPERISHKFVLVEDTGQYFKTKALVAESTTCGKQVAGLYESGIRMGISSRGFGKVKNIKGTSMVEKLFLESLGDIVFNPSAPGAYMQAIREGACEYIMVAGNLVLKNSSKTEEMIESHIKIINSAPKRKINEAAIQIFGDYLNKCF